MRRIRPYERPPASPTPINDSHPLARRIIGLAAHTPLGWYESRYTNYTVDTPRRFGPTHLDRSGSAGYGIGYNEFGPGWAGGSGGYEKLPFAARTYGRSDGGSNDTFRHSVLFVGSFGGNDSWVVDGQSVGDADYGTLYKNSSGNLHFQCGNGANYFSAALALPSTACTLLINSGDETNYAVAWLNGKKTTAAALGDGWPSPNYSIIYGSSAFPTGNIFKGVGQLFVVFAGWIDDVMALSLYVNPWQLFQPQQIYMPLDTGAAGGTNPKGPLGNPFFGPFGGPI